MKGLLFFFFFQAEDGIRDSSVTGVQTCALPILTKTVAWRRSVDVSTPVTVMNPMRGSFSSPTASARTARTDSLTRRMRLLIEGHHPALHASAHELLAVEVALGVVEQVLDLPVLARHARGRDARALPQLVMVDLRHRCAEALLQL